MSHKHPFELYRKCLICNKEFRVKSTKPNQKYCCHDCAYIGRKRTKEKICPNCGKSFSAYYKNTIFCSKSCKKIYSEKAKLEIYKKECEFCHKKYNYYAAMPNWFKEGQKNGLKYHGVDSSKYCSYECGIAHRQEVSKNTCKQKYGVEFTCISKNNLEKSKQTKLRRYGNEYYVNSEKIKVALKSKTKEEKEQIRLKIKQTNLKRYGNENYNGNKKYTEEELQNILEKAYNTFKKNNSFFGKGQINNVRCSLAEENIYKILTTKYSNVEFNKFIKTYGRCDFYIPELDLYIEYQGTWTHGGKPFENTNEDLIKLTKWKNKKTKYYNQAIYTWTKLDVKKRNTAKVLNLNWIEFFNMKEFENWFENIS